MSTPLANASAIRAGGYATRVHASFFTGTLAASGTLTADPVTPYTDLAVTYTSGAYTDAFVGFEVTFHDSGTGDYKGSGHIAYRPADLTSTNLPVREFATSNTPIASGDVFKIWRDVRLHDKLVAATDQFQPDYLDFTDEGTHPPAVACSGGHWAGRLDAGQTYASVSMTGSASYTADPASSHGVTHLWTLPTGVSFAPGSANTDADPTLRVTVGQYLARHAVTDADNSKTATQWVKLICEDPASPAYHVGYTPDAATADTGFGGTLDIYSGDTSLSAIPDLTTVIVWTDETVAGASASYRNAAPGREHILAVGIVRRDTSYRDQTRNAWKVEFISPLARLKELTSYSKAMLENASPDAWDKLLTLGVKRALVQIGQFYLNWNEAGYDILYGSDFLDKRYPAFYLQRNNFFAQMLELAQGVDARLGCDRSGRFSFATHPAYYPLASRSGVTAQWHFAPSDVLDYSFAREHANSVELYKTSGFTAGASGNLPIFATYPGAAPGEGVATPTRDKLICDDQADLNARTGRYGGEADNLFVDSDDTLWRAGELKLKLRGVYDFFDFGLNYADFSTTLPLKRGIDLTGLRFYLTSTQVSYDARTGAAVTNCTFKVATNCGAGATYYPPDSTLPSITIPAPPPITVRPPFGLNAGQNAIAAVNTDGYRYLTANFQNASPTWTRTAIPGLTGTLMDSVQDAFTPSRQVIVTSDAAAIYTVENFTASMVTTLRKTLRAGVTASYGYRFVDASFGADYIVVTSYYGGADGSWYCYSLDGGLTWSTEAQITAYSAGGANPAGLFVSSRSPGTALVSAYNASALGELYSLTSSFGAVADSGIANADYPAAVTKAWADNENTLFFSDTAVGGPNRIWRKIGSGAAVDVTPTAATGFPVYAPSNRSIHVAPTDAQTVLVAAYNPWIPGVGAYVVMSRSQGSSWTSLTLPAGATYYGAEVAGNNPNFGYLWGLSGAIATVDLTAGTITDRSGNLSDFSPGIFVRIRGA